MSADTITLPPDQSLRISTLLDRYVLLSVADAGLVVGNGTSYTDFSSFTSGVWIFAEGIGFASSIHSPHGLVIGANAITSPSKIEISTAGSPGEDQRIGSDAHPAQSGRQAGTLNIYVQRGTDENAHNISYVATGGDGGGAIVAGDKGGDAGPGGSVVRVILSSYNTLFTVLSAFLQRDDVVSGEPDTLVNQGDAVYTAALDLGSYPTDGTPDSIQSSMQTLRDTLSHIGEGSNCTLHDLAIAVRCVRNAVVEAIDDQRGYAVSSAHTDGGYPGSGKGVVGQTGSFGAAGSSFSLLLPQHDASYVPIDFAPSLKQLPFAFVHPEQCGMLLTRAKTFYYMGSAILRQEAAQMFRRIIDCLSFLPLSSTDPLYDAYTSSPIMLSGALNKLQSIYNDATTQLTHIVTGKDYNGDSDTFVPRASYTFYQGVLDAALDDMVALEDAYIAYHVALSKQEELQDAVGRALGMTNAMIASITADIGDLVKKLDEALNQIHLLTQPVMDTHVILLNEYTKLEDKIKNSFNLSVPEIINALTQLAFAPTKGMGAVQAGNLLYEGFETVPNLNGVSVNKDVIIGRLVQSEATVKGIKDTLTQDQLDGSFELDDPMGTRLLAIEDDMMSFLSDYANSSFEDVIEEMKSKFDDYISAVVARNAQVLQYNIVLKLLVQKYADKDAYTQKRDELQGKTIKADDPDLPEITAYMDAIYQSSRARVMKLLGFLVRSLNFRMLEQNDIYTLAFAQYGEVDKVPLTITSAVLRSARSRVEEGFHDAVEYWGSNPAKFPADFDKGGDARPGKRIHLKNSEMKTLLSKDSNYSVDVTIPPVFKETMPKNDFSGCCNVRLYRARFGFTGLKLSPLASSARITVRMVHKGTDTLIDKLNAAHKFTHDQISLIYSFNLLSDGTIQVLDDGNIAQADVNEVATSYAPPGPFADWTVSLADSDVNHLDFSEMKDAYFDFCGTNYALA